MDKLYFRVDMNSTIATGHLMRCLSIADAAKEQGVESIFITADAESAVLLSQRGYRNIVLGTAWNDMESEIEVLIQVIHKNCVKVLLVDSYYVTETYLKKVTDETFTVYIDDLNAFLYPVNVVICYANYYEKFDYEERYTKAGMDTTFLLGCDYIPLRREFAGLPQKQIKDRIEEVLVVSGGSDPYNAIESIVDSLLEKGIDRIIAICGRYNTRIDYLKSKYYGQNVTIYPAVDNLIEYIQSADLAISAGGSTLYELCACGTPALSFALADNQLANVAKFDEDGIIPCLGDVRVNDISRRISTLWNNIMDMNNRKRISGEMQSLVDANGAERIIKSILL